jgi:hypothetical protein
MMPFDLSTKDGQRIAQSNGGQRIITILIFSIMSQPEDVPNFPN